MKELWLTYARRFDALTLRERVMVAGAIALAVVYAIYALGVDPAQRRARMLAAQMKDQREEIAALQTRREAFSGRAGETQAQAIARRAALARRLEETDTSLRELHQTLVPAQRMSLLLQEMLRREPGLQLVALKTLPVVPLLPDDAQVKPREKARPKREFAGSRIYKHGVELTLRGGYEDLYRYLARLERSDWRMFWAGARLTTEARPQLTLTLTIYTLSLDRAWLEV